MTATIFAIKESKQAQKNIRHLQSTLEKLAGDLAANSGPQQSNIPLQMQTLKQRTAQLAHDLFAFLNDKGPEPPSPLRAKSEKEYREMSNAYFGRAKKIHYGYMAHFKASVEQTDNELAEAGFYTGLRPQDINPPEGKLTDVRKIAEALLLTAAKMPTT